MSSLSCVVQLKILSPLQASANAEKSLLIANLQSSYTEEMY
jgi:hypothetical protein